MAVGVAACHVAARVVTGRIGEWYEVDVDLPVQMERRPVLEFAGDTLVNGEAMASGATLRVGHIGVDGVLLMAVGAGTADSNGCVVRFAGNRSKDAGAIAMAAVTCQRCRTAPQLGAGHV